MTNSVKVLYVDYQGHPAPLSRCYHATASRRLSSSVDRIPPSTKTEVDSAYCPQCLSFHDAGTAASLGYCATCKQCPLCMAVASLAVSSNVAFYKCGYCSWTSQACQVTATVTPAEDGTIGKEQMLKASKDLVHVLQSKTDESSAETQYRDMLSAWEKIAKDSASHTTSKIKRGMKQQENAWTLQALEESIQTKQEKQPLLIANAKNVSMDNTPLMFDSSLETFSVDSMLLQPLASSTRLPLTNNDLLPLPMPLRARTSRRCRAELNEGRPGILVKPKLNPLEGDSSLRSGHAQWWKKDSSAHHVIPKMTVVKHTHKTVLLKVSNPTMGMVRMRLGPSDYRDKAGNVQMKHVLMDSLVMLYANLVVCREAVATLKPTEMVELDSVEDSFLEMGRVKLPDAVANWTPSEGVPSIQLVAAHKDAAWFELTVGECRSAKDQFVATPIALQIQVGDGSWESSLIKTKQTEGPDLVTFDVLVTWETIASDA